MSDQVIKFDRPEPPWSDLMNSDPCWDMDQCVYFFWDKFNVEPTHFYCNLQTLRLLRSHPDYRDRWIYLKGRHKEKIPRWLGLDEVEHVTIDDTLPDGRIKLRYMNTFNAPPKCVDSYDKTPVYDVYMEVL
jgi:hypothetical protein